jgi:hypothetical protein
MKTKLLFILMLTYGISEAQNDYWTGTNNTFSNIFRFGNVGVNTSTPLSKFHVNGGLRITGNAPNFGGPTILFGESGNPNAEYGKYYMEFIPNQGLNFGISWPNPGYGNYDLFLSTTRKVGIGTNNVNCSNCSGYRLFVKEGIKTEKIKVEIASINGWADYVFDDEYYLMPLIEVEAFISKNKHLPEVPSAQKIVENGGVELKEMNILLLKKVEELTLHLINLNNKIKSLEKKINQKNK